MADRVRLALVGLGRMGRAHLRALGAQVTAFAVAADGGRPRGATPADAIAALVAAGRAGQALRSAGDCAANPP